MLIAIILAHSIILAQASRSEKGLPPGKLNLMAINVVHFRKEFPVTENGLAPKDLRSALMTISAEFHLNLLR